MTREQAKQNLIALGVAEPTDEAVTSYLNQMNGETKKERDRADRLKADADKVSELQKQLDELNDANLSEIEKANKATETANNRVAELEKQMLSMQNKTKLAEMGIIGEQADKLIDANGSISFETLGQIISERETKARANMEAELLQKTPNPNGSGSGQNDDAKPADVENASKLNFGVKSADTDTKNYYVLN